MKIGFFGAVAIITLAMMTGCVSVKAPDVKINESPRPAPVNSANTPHPTTLEQAQVELDRAYQNIRYLEDQLSRYKDKYEDCKRDKKKAEKEREDWEERYEDLKDQYD